MSALSLLAGLAGLAALATAPDGCGADGAAHVARIEMQQVDPGSDLYRLAALHDGPAGHTLTYRFEVVREGGSGRSRSTQSGTFEPSGVSPDTLSTTRVNVGAGDRLEATLTLLRGVEVVARDTLTWTVDPAP